MLDIRSLLLGCALLSPGALRVLADEPQAAPAGLRSEFFLLEEEPRVPDGPASAGAQMNQTGRLKVAGVVARRRRNSRERLILECDVRFEDQNVRVWHTESFGHDVGADAPVQNRLVWREAQDRSVRTWLLDCDPDMRGARVTRWSGEHQKHEVLQVDGELQLPLALVERLRLDDGSLHEALCPAPLSGRLERISLKRIAGAELRALIGAERLKRLLSALPPECAASENAQAPLRCIEWWRPDGSLRGRYLYRGTELLAFQWQAGGLWARRVSREDHRRWASTIRPGK